MIQIKRTDSTNSDFQELVILLDKELWDTYNDSMNFYDQHNKVENNNHVVVAYKDETPIGCGCFKEFDGLSAEMKRMFVKKEYRGKGVSKLVLSALEDWAKETGFRNSILETGYHQEVAVGLYKNTGYLLIENYPPYVGMEESICFGKEL